LARSGGAAASGVQRSDLGRLCRLVGLLQFLRRRVVALIELGSVWIDRSWGRHNCISTSVPEELMRYHVFFALASCWRVCV